MKTSGKTNAELIAEGKVPPHYAVGKSDGDAPVQRWIALLPGWQAVRAGEVDALVSREVAPLAKGIRYNGAWYGVPGGGWFLAVNSLKHRLKLTFFDGLHLDPLPPFAFKQEPARGLDLRETDALDEARLAGWLRQALRLPGYGTVKATQA